MHRNVNKEIYEIEAQINDIYYGRAVQIDSASNIRNNSSLTSNFGYGTQSNLNNNALQMMKNTNNSLGHVSEIQIQHFQSKIESIKLYFNDLEHYFNNNKDEFVSQSNTEYNISSS